MYNMQDRPNIDIASARKLLGNLVASIANGEIEGVVITRYGKPMALLGPIRADEPPATAGVAVGAPPRSDGPTGAEAKAHAKYDTPAGNDLLRKLNKKQ